MDTSRQEELDSRLSKSCEELDFEGVCKAIADGANADCSLDCGDAAWWLYCPINVVLNSAFWGDDNDLDTAYRIVKHLLKHGANPNKMIRCDKGQSLWTPLEEAFNTCPDTKIPRLLLEHGAEVNLPHDDEQWPLFDMVRHEWYYTPRDCMQKPGESLEQGIRRNGLLFFDKRELLLEHSAQTYWMLHAADLWKELNEGECDFLDACSSLDIATIRRLLGQAPALIDTKDKHDHCYGDYVVRWSSHHCRCEAIGHREQFEQRVIDVLEYLVSQDENPYGKLVDAAECSIEYGYPAILDWLLKRMTLLDCAKLAEKQKGLADFYLADTCYVLPDDIRDKVEALLGVDASQRDASKLV